jgi:hypothetical protein
MNSTIKIFAPRAPSFARTSGMLSSEAAGQPLSIEHLAFDNTDQGEQLAIEISGSRDVTIKDVVSAGVTLVDRKQTGGRLFIENVCCGKMQTAGPLPVFARQLDTEGTGIRILNRGSPLWLLGLKTEGIATILDNRDGAHSDIFGGLLYMVRDAEGSAIPAFSNADSWLSASFAEESLRPSSRYRLYLTDSEKGRTSALEAARFPERGYGRIAPGIVATPDLNPPQ